MSLATLVFCRSIIIYIIARKALWPRDTCYCLYVRRARGERALDIRVVLIQHRPAAKNLMQMLSFLGLMDMHVGMANISHTRLYVHIFEK
jgi:hypothetical protein